MKEQRKWHVLQGMALLILTMVVVTGCKMQAAFKYVDDVFGEVKTVQDERSKDKEEDQETNQNTDVDTGTDIKPSTGQDQDTETIEKVPPEEKINVGSEGEELVIDNPDDIVAWVNKERNLPKDYVPEDLVVPNVRFSFDGENEKRYLRKVAAEALEALFNQAKQEGLDLVAVSGYRSYQRQESIFNWNVEKKGFEEANKVSAKPGQSEHQLGLAMDVSCHEVGYALTDEFENTKEGQWLKDHAHEYGFIIRYPKDKVEITKYVYEPWHIRYVGVDVATIVYEQQLTLEEYFALP